MENNFENKKQRGNQANDQQDSRGKVQNAQHHDSKEQEMNKEEKAQQENGKPHANQYTQGRNDDRGRKE
jgi:hypothetical protein